ncbi:H(+)/Cl(-) exchange transporter 7 [Coccomyxa sp. Obi]|nr:H(+)/Cl(-) exchange transporter 7 [Coccomyxa sp. Obi]
MEEACTHWSRKVAWRCFVCTTVAVIAVAQLNPEWKRGVLSFYGIKEMGAREWFVQLPLFAAVSICSGLLGALFNALHKALLSVRAPRTNNRLRMAEGAGLAALTIVMMLALSYFLGTCVEVPDWQQKNYGFTFHCPEGKYNDLATAFMAFPDKTISHLFSLGSLTPQFEVCQGENCYFTLRSLMILCPSYLIFMALNGGLSVPGGLFMPSIMVGASFGATCGLLLMKWLPAWEIQPGIYAMCGAAAMLGGVFRASISLVVIFVEGSQSTKYLVGIIIAVICSNWVGEAIHSDGIYETDLEADGSVIFLRPSPPQGLFAKSAGQIACKAVWSFRTIESVAYVVRVLRHCSHNGFPVVRGWPGDSEDDVEDDTEVPLAGVAEGAARGTASREGPLEGVILRSQLMVLLANRAFCDERGVPLTREQAGERLARELELDRRMRMYHRHSDTQTWCMARQPSVDSTIGSSPDLESFNPFEADGESLRRPRLYMDLRPFLDCGPITVRPETPAERAHMAFVSLGLRHLCVVDENSRVRGIITRRDLDYAAGHGAWRRNKMAPAPDPPPADRGLGIPSRTSSGALVRLTALRHMLGQRATSARSAAELAHFLSYGEGTPEVANWLSSSDESQGPLTPTNESLGAHTLPERSERGAA